MTDSIASTDSGVRLDCHPPTAAERTNGLSLRVCLVRTQCLASFFSSARILSAELNSMARCKNWGLVSIFQNEERSRKPAMVESADEVSRCISS